MSALRALWARLSAPFRRTSTPSVPPVPYEPRRDPAWRALRCRRLHAERAVRSLERRYGLTGNVVEDAVFPPRRERRNP